MASLMVVGSILLLDMAIRIFLDLGIWSPDLLLLAIIHTALTRPMGEAYLIAFTAGLVWDGVYQDLLGMHALLFLLTVLITGKLRGVIWPSFAITRLFLGCLLTGLVRFGEVIFWLSNVENQIPLSLPKRYVLAGTAVTGICFWLFPWKPHSVRWFGKPSRVGRFWSNR